MTAQVHELVEPIAFLLGTWQGEGRGEYPTIDDFSYGEEVTFSHTGRPFLVYSQRTWSVPDGSPMHQESGFWRPQGNGSMEVVLSHSFGAVEIDLGFVGDDVIDLASQRIVGAPSAKRIDAIRRRLHVDGDVLSYTVEMAAVGRPLLHHLSGELKRTTS